MSYGYMWEIALKQGLMAQSIGHDMYFRTGMGGQVMATIPDSNVVFVFLDPDEKTGQLFEMILDALL